MVEILEKIKDPIWKAFAFRVYNTFVTSVLPILGGAVIVYIQENELPIAISSLASIELWDYVLGSLVVSLASSLAAGVEKATRESIKLQGDDEEELLDQEG